MKNSKEYSKKILSLYQSLKRKSAKSSGHQSKTWSNPDPVVIVDSIIFGIISEKYNEKETEASIKRFSEYFVDWNDLRVSRPEEIAEMLGADTPDNRQIALTITKVLQKIFNENHQINLESLQKLGKRQARQKLEKMEELSRFVIDYCMLTSLGSHAIPLTEKMIEYLKANNLVDNNADAETIEGFLSKQISAKNGYEFYELLRQESESHTTSGSGENRGVAPDTSGEALDNLSSDESPVESHKLERQTTNNETKTKHTTKKKAETKKKSAGREPKGRTTSRATRSRTIGTTRSTGKSVKTKKKTKKK